MHAIMNDKNRNIIVIDQTIREGMQHRGIMLNKDERLKIIEFQNQLGVDVSQAAYPPAHESERTILKNLNKICSEKGFNIKLAGHCRSLVKDAKFLVDIGISNFHLHSGISKYLIKKLGEKQILENLVSTVNYIRENRTAPIIKVSLLDIGKTDKDILISIATFLIDELEVDIVTLPDTSGIMNPLEYYENVFAIYRLSFDKKTHIGVHCHNDLGMATANTIMGVFAGASVIEVSVLGIGERNGIGDLFIVGKVLKSQGFNIKLHVENTEVFNAYYSYINDLYLQKIGEPRINYNTPYFGDSIISHVAGTHGIGDFGINDKAVEQKYFFNVFTGKNILIKFAQQFGIIIDDVSALKIVINIKNLSYKLNRHITAKEVLEMIKTSKDI
jgi:isopropylmalate/homocitrate/citramalate synthase